MRKRTWLYLPAAIIALGLVAFWNWESTDLQAQAADRSAKSLAATQTDLKAFLAKQTDGPKLIGLAKRLNKNDAALVRLVIEKAYALAPTYPDAVRLESAYQPALKAKALELNPLFDQKIDPASPLGQLR